MEQRKWQKERIIIALKKAGFVVGYMGDGINDASALHAADVSISVDSAVDVAKKQMLPMELFLAAYQINFCGINKPLQHFFYN